MRHLKSAGGALCCLMGAVLLAGSASGQTEDPERKQAMIELGLANDSAWDLYQALVERAGGGQTLEWDNIPDWSGVYSRGGNIFNFDPDQGQDRMPTARLTPEFQAALERRLDLRDQGVEYDNLSTCAPPGHPRWLTEPFLREFVIAPHQTWLINEMVNDIRRVYTDGRGHTPEDEAYPLYNGDSIGVWDGDRLIMHTSQLMAGVYQRTQPDYTDQVETVEIWQKVDDRNLKVDVWVYDPPALEEPWYSRQTYIRLTDPDNSLRLRYWHCAENPNNTVIETEEGASQFDDFTFD